VKIKAEINAESLTSLCTLDIICGTQWIIGCNTDYVIFNFLIESAMGYRVDAQTKESEYVKAVHTYVIINESNVSAKYSMVKVTFLLGKYFIS
jgi:hypothetical protein